MGSLRGNWQCPPDGSGARQMRTDYPHPAVAACRAKTWLARLLRSAGGTTPFDCTHNRAGAWAESEFGRRGHSRPGNGLGCAVGRGVRIPAGGYGREAIDTTAQAGTEGVETRQGGEREVEPLRPRGNARRVRIARPVHAPTQGALCGCQPSGANRNFDGPPPDLRNFVGNAAKTPSGT